MISRIRKHLSFSNVVAGIALFIALGGSAYAVGKNTVGTKQIKNNAVTAKKIKNNAITTSKVKNGAITGSKVKLSSLGKVPSAGTADTAASATTATTADEAATLTGQKNVFVKIPAGQSVELVKYGQVSITAKCTVNNVGNDIVEAFGSTTADGAVLGGNDDLGGGPLASDFLNINTPEDDRSFASNSDDTGVTAVDTDIDEGFVLGPDGKGIVANTEGLILGLNYLGSPCMVAGVFNYVG